MAKVALTAEQRAAILAGATEVDIDDPKASAGAPEESAEVKAAREAAEAQAKAAAEAQAKAAAEGKLVEYLQGELTKTQASLTEATVKLATVEKDSKDAAETQPKLLAIVRDVIGTMQVALGTDGKGAAALSAKDAVVEHAAVSKTYLEKFKVGGVGVHTPAVEPKAASVVPLFAERIAIATAK